MPNSRYIFVAPLLVVVAAGLLLIGMAAARRIDATILWVVDVSAIALPALIAEGSCRLGRQKFQLLAWVAYPLCFGFAGTATLRLAAQQWAAPSAIAIVVSMSCVLVAWACQWILFGATLPERDSASRWKDSVLTVIIRQGPWAGSLLGAFGTTALLRESVPGLSLTAIAVTVVAAAIASSYVASVAGTAILSFIAGSAPEEVRESLSELTGITGLSFSRIIYLDSTLASGAFCEVRPDWRGHALALNKWTFTVLSREERLAVLAHEVAHLRQRYLMKEIAVSGVLSTSYILAVVSVISLLRVRGLAAVLVIAVGMVMSSVVHAAFKRHLERDADQFATRAIGVGPMLGALSKLATPMPWSLLSHHDSYAERVSRIRSVVRNG